MKRKPYVAGYFYPSAAGELQRMVSGFIDTQSERKKAIAVISPHAGLIYSGPVAGTVYSSVEMPESCILLGPSHGYMTNKAALHRKGVWETPMGEVKINEKLTDGILKQAPWVKEDGDALAREHSLEVQLPFLQYLKSGLSIVPIIVSYYSNYADLEKLGKALAAAVKNYGKEVLLIASTDMSHQVSQETAREKDFLALDEILELKPKNLYDVVRENNISMCGFQATTATLIAAKELGAREAKLIRYQTSGDVTGDYQEVVGYAGIRIT